jgi:hypothetical protein
MELVSVAAEGGSFAARWLPRFIARRVFTEEKMLRQVSFELRDNSPIHLGGSPARLCLWFRFVNHSSLDVSVDRFIIEAWVGQPIALMAVLVPFVVPARGEATDVLAQAILSADVAAYAATVAATPLGRIYLYGTAICKTSVRDFVIRTTVERDAAEAKISGLPPTTGL